MRSKIYFVVAVLVACVVVFYPAPSHAVLTINSNYLISGSLYLRRASWVGFRLSRSPTTLWQSDTIRKRSRTEAVVLCSDFSLRTVSSSGELAMSTICPEGQNSGLIENEEGNMLPTSQGNQDNEELIHRPEQLVETLESPESDRMGTTITNIPSEVSSTINRLDGITMADSTRAFIAAQIYRNEGLFTEAISLLESIQVEDIPRTNQFQNYANYQLLGDLYTEIEKYDEAKSSYSIALNNIINIEISSSNFILFGRLGAVFDEDFGSRAIPDTVIESKAETLLALGRISLDNNDYLEAIASLSEARELYAQLEGSSSPTVRALNTERLEEIVESTNAQAEELRNQIDAQDITAPRRMRGGSR